MTGRASRGEPAGLDLGDVDPRVGRAVGGAQLREV
jgi:hypothetical protein